MTFILRITLIVLSLLLLWPEFERYRAEWMLGDANARLEGVLHGTLKGHTAIVATDAAIALSQHAAQLLPDDPRPQLSESVALLLRQRGAQVIALLEPAITAGERPELTLNLGRARGISGDQAGANAAFLRTAWANPAAIATLPKAIRDPLLERVGELEAQLRAGQLQRAPSLQAR